MDKNAYIQLMYSGHGKPATLIVLSIIGGYQEQEAYTYDVEKAKEEEQTKVYGEAQKMAWEIVPWLFLGNDQIIYFTKSYLSGVYVSPDGAFNL